MGKDEGSEAAGNDLKFTLDMAHGGGRPEYLVVPSMLELEIHAWKIRGLVGCQEGRNDCADSGEESGSFREVFPPTIEPALTVIHT